VVELDLPRGAAHAAGVERKLAAAFVAEADVALDGGRDVA
jgi:hypothetical protein